MYSLGIDPTEVSTTPKFDVGQVAFNDSGSGAKGYIYVLAGAGGITGEGYVVDITGNTFSAVMSTTTTTAPGTGAGKAVGVGVVAIAAASYGWVQVYGPCNIRVSASCAAYTLINSTATAGQLDDDATAGAEVINGLALTTANGGAAGNVAGFANWPNVGRTL